MDLGSFGFVPLYFVSLFQVSWRVSLGLLAPVCDLWALDEWSLGVWYFVSLIAYPGGFESL